MKNYIFTMIITLSLGILTSCEKKEDIRTTFKAFSESPFILRNVLATAD